jgi:hypothetical protein
VRAPKLVLLVTPLTGRPAFQESARPYMHGTSVAAHSAVAREREGGWNWSIRTRTHWQWAPAAYKTGPKGTTHGRTQRPPSGVADVVEPSPGRTTILPWTQLGLIDLRRYHPSEFDIVTGNTKHEGFTRSPPSSLPSREVALLAHVTPSRPRSLPRPKPRQISTASTIGPSRR